MRWVVICLALLSLPCAPPVAAQHSLSPQNARQAAAIFLTRGHPRAALDVTEALLERDPSDAEALILQAHAQRTLKDYANAQASARKAWHHSKTDIQHYEAARAMAQALSSDNHKSRAQLWLRRAAHVAPSAQLRKRAERDYRFVQMLNPWSVNLRFAIAPSDNVNNAPRDNTLILGGLLFEDETAIPLSGVEFALGASLRYNFDITQTSRSFVRLAWDHAQVVITDDDKPESVDASDFTYSKLEATIGKDLKLRADGPNTTASLSFGRIWFGGDHLSDELRARFSWAHDLAETRSLTWYGSLGYSDRQDEAIRSGVTALIGATWTTRMRDIDRLSLSASLSRTNTDSAVLTHDALTFGATYTLGRPVLNAVASFSAFGRLRRYDDAIYGPDPREDDGAILSTSLFFKDFDTHGFAPKVTLTARRTTSNVTRFDTRHIGVSIGFQSVF